MEGLIIPLQVAQNNTAARMAKTFGKAPKSCQKLQNPARLLGQDWLSLIGSFSQTFPAACRRIVSSCGVLSALSRILTQSQSISQKGAVLHHHTL